MFINCTFCTKHCAKFWGCSRNKPGKTSCSNGTYTLLGEIDNRQGKQVTYEQITYGMLDSDMC